MIEKKKIKICALHPDIKSVENISFTSLLADKFNFEWNEENPEYVVASEVIYYQKSYEKKFKKYLENKDIILISYFGECISPDMNLFDYACVFDRGMAYNDRIFRVPTLLRYKNSIFSNISEKEQMIKNKFCNFMYANPEAPESRDKLFYCLNKYKKVDSLGPHLNNMGNQITRYTDNWAYQSIVERLPYKFSIAAENAWKTGYITEKILCCIQADTIPIYWGDPTIGQEFNEKRFINCHKYQNFDEVLHVVQQIDENEELWDAMITQPLQTPEQVQKDNIETQNFVEFLSHIFEQNLEQAKRRDDGYHPNLYRKWLYRENDNRFVSTREQRLKSANEVYQCLLRVKQKGHSLEEILKRKGWKQIAIYAMGDTGKIIYDELEHSVIKVIYAIDRSKISYKGLRVLSLNHSLEKVDCIIVSLPDEYESIEESIKKVTDIKIADIQALLMED